MDDQVKGVVEGNEENAFNQNQQIIDRLKQVSGAESDRDLASVLGIKPQNITTAKKRRIPEKWIISISKRFNCQVNYLLTGEGGGTHAVGGGHMNETDSIYGQQSGDIGKEEWEILGKAHAIITSQSEYKSPFIQCINAFHEALTSRKEIETLKMRIQVLDKVNKANSSKGIEEEDQNRSAI